MTLKDRSGVVRTAPIGLDGSFSLDVSGLRAPFALRADGTVGGKRYSVHSAAVAADVNGRVNITPLTDLILANVAHDVAAAYFDPAAFGSLTRAELDGKAAALRDRLLPVLQALGLGATVDLLRAAFSADHTGLDAVLDVVKVDVDPQTKVATVRNIMNGSSFTNDVVDATVVGTLSGAGVAAGLTTVESLAESLSSLTRLFATRAPTEAEVHAADLFDEVAFLHEGEGWTRFVPGLVAGVPAGAQFRNVALETSGADAVWATFDVVLGGAVAQTVRMEALRDAGSGRWRWAGNQRRWRVELAAHANHWPGDVDPIASGFLLTFTDPADLVPLGSSVTVTGPGLPGVTFTKTLEVQRFTRTIGQDDPTVWLSDGAIAAIPAHNPEYTFEVWAAGSTATLVDTFTVTVPSAPLPVSALSPASFIQKTGFSPGSLAGFAGGTITATFQAPATVRPLWFFVVLADAAWAQTTWIGGTVAPGRTSAAAVAPAPGFTPAHGYSFVGGVDVFQREFETRLIDF